MVYVFLADGFEEMEALCPVDLLRRASVEVRTVSVMNRLLVQGAHGIAVEADCFLSDLEKTPDAAVLPGGLGGVKNLGASAEFCTLLRTYRAAGVTLAAICAAPTLLSSLGLLEGRRVTCYPSCAGEITDGVYVNETVCTEEGLITSAGPGTAAAFGLALIARLKGREEADAVARGALLA